MTRVRWIHVRFPSSMRSLAGHLRGLLFAQGSTDGFIIEKVREDTLEARYIERHEVMQSVVSPFGEELSFSRTEFRDTHFSIDGNSNLMEIVDPPRALSRLFTRLSESCDFRLSVKEITIDVDRWRAFIESEINQSVKIQKIQISKLSLRDDAQASAVIQGVRDVRSLVGLLTRDRACQIDKLQIAIQADSKAGVILTRRGAASIESVRPKFIAEKLRLSLIKALEPLQSP